MFFAKQNVEALIEAVEKMECCWKNFDPDAFQLQMSRFGRGRYKKQMAHAIEFGYKKWKS